MRLQIDPEFRDACPPLSKGEYELLEADVLKNGIREDILHWKGVIVDGHNRYGIAQKHNIPFRHKAVDFPSRADAIAWIVRNQIARRNLTREHIRYLWGKHFASITKPNFKVDTPPKSISSAAKDAGVTRTKLKRDIKFAEEVDKMPAEQKAETLAGKKKAAAPKAEETQPEKPVITQASQGLCPLHIEKIKQSTALPTCLSLIDKIIATINKAANDDTGSWLATGPLKVALDQARACISAAVFFDVCPECSGRKGGCDECRRTGWVPRFRYDEIYRLKAPEPTVSNRGRR